MGTVTFERTCAPFAAATGEVDFTGDALAFPLRVIRLDHLADELVTRYSAEAVIASPEFEIGVADASAEEADECVSFGAAGTGEPVDFDTPVFEVDSKHSGSA
jgi:hypothetical protein